VFDSDGDGSLSVAELMRGVELYKASQKKVKNLTYAVTGLFVALIVVCGVAFGLTYASSLQAIQATKDMQASASGALADISGNVRGRRVVTP
jgi:hypothetical protein